MLYLLLKQDELERDIQRTSQDLEKAVQVRAVALFVAFLRGLLTAKHQHLC